jgi:protein-L-isoaspartate O-methyltransferase
LVIPFGEGEMQEMMVIHEDAEGQFITEKHGAFSFVPMLENKNKSEI